MPTITENKQDIRQTRPRDTAALENKGSVSDAPLEENLEKLFNQIVEKNLTEIKEEEKEKREDRSKAGLKDKLNQVSKVLFSRESTYRGIIDILAEELPSFLIECLRGANSALEHLFKYIITTSVIMGVPFFTKFFASTSAKKILNTIDPQQHGLALLFNRNDLESFKNFEKARARIIKEESLDQMNLIRLWGLDSKKTAKHLSKARTMKDFISGLNGSDKLRKEFLKLKDTVLQRQTIFMSIVSGAIPYITRLFRKYVLGANRFTGSQKYLNDEDAEKLGNSGFTLKQGLGTLLCMGSSPLVASHLIKQFNSKNPKEHNSFEQMMSKQLDTKHSYYPKVGTYIMSTSLPYFISRIFNAQDKYEFLEVLIKTSFAGGSLFMGDRVTNGRYAKAADKELSEKYGSESGILHHPQDPKKGFWSWLGNIFPEARKFPEIVEMTKHNKELQKEATDKYQSSFLKGFGVHTMGIIVLKYLVNKMTQFRVTKDLKKLKAN